MNEFEEIYIKYVKCVKKFLICLSKDINLAEELTQETFYQAVKSIDRYNGKCKMNVWLCQIAKHLFYDYLKKQKKYKKVSIDEVKDLFKEIPSKEITLIEKIILDEKLEKINKYISELKKPHSEVFMLRIYGELSFREIGEIFEKNENWARVTFYRVKIKLLERIGND